MNVEQYLLGLVKSGELTEKEVVAMAQKGQAFIEYFLNVMGYKTK
jgi:hypothetical protein